MKLTIHKEALVRHPSSATMLPNVLPGGTRLSDFLNFVADRFVHVYHESPNVDFVLRLRELAEKASLHTETSEAVARRVLLAILDAMADHRETLEAQLKAIDSAH